VKIPPGTSSGQKLRLRGKGVAGDGGERAGKGEPPGDQYVVVRVVVPKKVDGEAARLMREFQERTGFNPRADVHW
jgi:DnaJ-class molecular chaperone